MRASRRALLVGAAAGGVGFCLPALAASATALPNGTMRLTRRSERSLSGGAKIVVERGWNIRFAPQGSGATINGEQAMVHVTAPESLAQLAQIEEARSTDKMFPILLSGSGLIVGAGDGLLEKDVTAAVREAERMIAARPIAANVKRDQLHHLALLQQSAGKLLEDLPADLFFPVSPALHSVQPVVVADGVAGEFEISYSASRAPGQSWLDRAELSVTTRIGASERHAREVWMMTAL